MRRPTARLTMVAALIWCGVTRRVRSTALPLLILAGISLIPTEVGAGSITYNVMNYPTIQDGYTVSGTITTNATTGTSLPGTDISSFDITITMGSTTVAEFTPANSPLALGTFDATPTTLSVGTNPDNLVFESHTAIFGWLNLSNISTLYTASLQTFPITTLWAGNLPSIDSPIATTATVPEPPSAVLASIGAVVVFLAYGWSRHRRVQHRLEAD
jgi:hypothetical protein